MPQVNPEILVWARETAGLDEAEAARKINLRAARGRTPEARLAALESGTESPSRALLSRMAKQYRRPLVAFYLDAPPAKSDRGQDFRTLLPGDELREEPLLDALIRDLLARQDLVKAALEAEDEVDRVEFVGSLTIETDVDRAVAEAIRWLDFDRSVYRAARKFDDAFAYLRRCAEDAGIFVLLIGDLGSYHTSISEDVFRGYALADEVAPFIVINDRDARSAWPFTLLHEFCHILLGMTGVSDVFGASGVEKFCNDVASRVLVDDAELIGLGARVLQALPSARTQVLSDFAEQSKVSRALLAYRLLQSGHLSYRRYNELRTEFYEQWRESQRQERERQRSQEGGPSYYTLRRHRIGEGLLATVSYLLGTGSLTTSRAARVLGVKPKNVAPLLVEAANVA